MFHVSPCCVRFRANREHRGPNPTKLGDEDRTKTKRRLWTRRKEKEKPNGKNTYKAARVHRRLTKVIASI